MLLPRRFTDESLALSLRRGDEDFRLAVDRALSHAFSAAEFRGAYAKWFGDPDAHTTAFFRMSSLPD
jgi:polar amino acid transport system substrate-binding protein